jgi:hypothetical protein
MTQTQIYIKLMKDKAKKITLQVELTDYIDEVKKKIEIQEGTPAQRQNLFFLGEKGYSLKKASELEHLKEARMLKQWMTLEDYKIERGSIIHVDIRRITVGDEVCLVADKPCTKTGKVIRDDGTNNPYIVEWDDNGEESEWLSEQDHGDGGNGRASVAGRFDRGRGER